MDGRYLVMTNFPNQTIVGKHYLEADGKGADRYQICHNYLRQHIDDFSIDHGFELLSMACNLDPQYPTSCSMVFDPQQNEIYIVLHKEFSKIWKLSIERQTIEGWKGFHQPVRIPITPGPEGLPADDLIRQESSQDDRGILS